MRERAFVFWFISFFLFVFHTNASEYSSRLWQMEEGLPHNIVQAITQTRDGYLWVGTREGLARFDGVRFTEFEIVGETTRPSISALCEDDNGNLWISTENSGLFCLSNGKISLRQPPNRPGDFLVSEIHKVADGTLWMSSNGTVSRLKDGKIQVQKELPNIGWSFYADGDGVFWGDNTLKQFDGKRVEVWPVRTGRFPPSPRKIIRDRNGVFWLGSTTGLTRVENGIATYFPKGDGPQGIVSMIFEDRKGNLWIGAYGGLSRFVDGEFVSEGEDDGTFYRVYSIFEDREGNIWIGSEEGLARLTPKTFMTYTKEQGLTQNSIATICPSRDGSIWIAAWGGGLNHLVGEAITTFGQTNGLATDFVMAVHEGRDGSLWVGLDHAMGLNRIKDGKVIHYGRSQGLVDLVMTAIIEDRQGNVWIGSREALNRFKDEKFIRYTTDDGLSHNKINAICEGPEKIIWIGTEGGLTQWDDGRFIDFAAKEPRLKTSVLSLYEDGEDTLWIGTKGAGLARLRNGELNIFTSAQGLFSDSIYGIVEDDRNNLWLNSSKGIFQVSKKKLDEIAHGIVPVVASFSYGEMDGIISSSQYRDVMQPAACKGTDGRLWFRTTQGAAVVDPEKITANELKPPVVIESVIADKRSAGVQGLKVNVQSQEQLSRASATLNIPPGRGELEIHYTALSFRAPGKNRFKYKLEGRDLDWVDADTRRVAYYNTIPPGKYRFRVIASNNDGIWNKTGASLALVLQPHFWQTWWFLCACGIAATGFVGGTARYVTRKKMQRKLERLEQQHAVEKERSRIARDMHDELGAKLTRISFQGASAKRHLANPVEVEQQIEKMSRTARELVLSLDEIVWAVDPENDSLDNLANYICRHASEFFENSSIICQFVIPSELPNRRLATDVRHNVFLAVKEALNNVLKHSEATRVEITIAADPKLFKIIISDNGCGFTQSDPEKTAKTKRGGHGLANLRERMSAIHGEFKMRNGEGTRLEFIVPLKEETQ